MAATYIIVGGGIAGVSCVESISFLHPNERVILITASSLVKCVANIVNISKILTQFEVKEEEAEYLLSNNPSLTIVHDEVVSINSSDHFICTRSGQKFYYKKLCICTGASPKVISEANPNVIGIRDTDSVKNFQERIKDARRILVIGNGGIATEIIYEVQNVEIIWVIKDKHISAAFIDPGAAEFLQDKLLKKDASASESPIIKRLKYQVTEDERMKQGAALGPDWHSSINLVGKSNSKVIVEYCSEVKSILSPGDDWAVKVELTNEKIYECDFIVSATGVVPNSCNILLEKDDKFILNDDGGIQVDWKLETNISDIFAAGDICSANWELATHWFQMRLWTQARQMGMYAAKCMVGSQRKEEILQDFCFELFNHVTKFFGHKVVLLGLFNGQKLGNGYEILLRVTKGREYVKLVMVNGRMQGAVLIGETDLEEMCENLILNQLDLSDFGEDLLDPDIDIDDYFD